MSTLEKCQLANGFSVSIVNCDGNTLLSAKKRVEESKYLSKFCSCKLNIVSYILKSKGSPSLDFWAYEKGQSARIYRPGFINKNDEINLEIKIFFHKEVDLKKKLVTFPLFNFCLYQQELFLNCEIYIDQTK